MTYKPSKEEIEVLKEEARQVAHAMSVAMFDSGCSKKASVVASIRVAAGVAITMQSVTQAPVSVATISIAGQTLTITSGGNVNSNTAYGLTFGATTLTATVLGSVTDGPNGQVAFYPATAPEMLLGDAGDYEGEIEITFSDATVQTVYDVLKFKLREDF
mgnify:CR=1 FL=1